MPESEKKELIAEMKKELVITLKAMQPEMEAGVEKKIEATVNGKINDFRREFDSHRKDVQEFMALMAPAAEGIRIGASLRKFAVWLSGFAGLGIIWLSVKSLLGR